MSGKVAPYHNGCLVAMDAIAGRHCKEIKRHRIRGSAMTLHPFAGRRVIFLQNPAGDNLGGGVNSYCYNMIIITGRPGG